LVLMLMTALLIFLAASPIALALASAAVNVSCAAFRAAVRAGVSSTRNKNPPLISIACGVG
jgi:hypothetical protein